MTADSPRYIWGFSQSSLPPPSLHWSHLFFSFWTTAARWSSELASASEAKKKKRKSQRCGMTPHRCDIWAGRKTQVPSNRIRPLPYIIRGSVTQQKQQNKCRMMRWLHRLSQDWPSNRRRITHVGLISANPSYTGRDHMNLNKNHLFQHFKKAGSKPSNVLTMPRLLMHFNIFCTFKHPGQKYDKPGKPWDINITEHIRVSYYRFVLGKAAPHSSHSIAQPKMVESLC